MSWLLLKQNQKKVSSKKTNKTEITKTLLITAPCFMFASLQVQFAGRTPCPHASVTNWSSWVAAHSGQSKGSVVSHVGHNQSHTHTHTLWSRDKPIQTDTVWTVSNCPQMSLCETKSQEPQHCHRRISTNKQRVSRDDHCYCLLFSNIWANDSNEKICTGMSENTDRNRKRVMTIWKSKNTNFTNVLDVHTRSRNQVMFFVTEYKQKTNKPKCK